MGIWGGGREGEEVAGGEQRRARRGEAGLHRVPHDVELEHQGVQDEEESVEKIFRRVSGEEQGCLLAQAFALRNFSPRRQRDVRALQELSRSVHGGLILSHTLQRGDASVAIVREQGSAPISQGLHLRHRRGVPEAQCHDQICRWTPV